MHSSGVPTIKPALITFCLPNGAREWTISSLLQFSSFSLFLFFPLSKGRKKKGERGGQRVIWVSMFDQFLNEVIMRGRTDPLLPFPFPWLLFEGWFAREERKKKEKEQEEEKEVKADYKAVLNWYSDLFLFAGEKLRRRINSNLWPLPRPVRIIKVLLRANSNPATHPFLFLSPPFHGVPFRSFFSLLSLSHLESAPFPYTHAYTCL